jgi:hypothetical protein
MVGDGVMKGDVCVCNCGPEFLAGAILSGLIVGGLFYLRARKRAERRKEREED